MDLASPGLPESPAHVAIIMDGNGRWAAARGLPRLMGHRAGVEAVRNVVRAAGELGLRCLTLYSFSTENWRRPQSEVRELMRLMFRFVDTDLKELCENGVKIRIIGRRDNLSQDVAELIERVERETAGNDKLSLNIAFNYGGRDEIVRRAAELAEAAAKGLIGVDDIDEAMFDAGLDTQDLPEPDLVIRTSGEQRISNFLLWQTAYAEFIFVDTLWPEFDKQSLADAIDEFHRRERRYGGVENVKSIKDLKRRQAVG